MTSIAFSNSWPEVRLKDVCTFNYGKSLPSRNRLGNDIQVYGSNGVVGVHGEALTHGPTIIVGRKGSVGKVHLSPNGCWPIDTTYFVDERSTIADLRWLYYRLTVMGLQDLDSSAAVPGLNRDHAGYLQLRLPPLAIQRKIAAILSAYDDLIENNNRRIKLLEEMAQRIYREWFVDFRYPGHEAVPLVDSELGPIPEGWRVGVATV